MSDIDSNNIERFLHAQVEAWNASDKEAFFEQYRSTCPNGLVIEYVGRPPLNVDGWTVLAVFGAATLIGTIPAVMALRRSLADGLTVKL